MSHSNLSAAVLNVFFFIFYAPTKNKENVKKINMKI